MLRWIVVFVAVFLLKDIGASEREKRCIVIQKQSGSHGDSSEADDEEYRRPQKEPRPSPNTPDRLQGYDTENLNPEKRSVPELLRYKLMPKNSYENIFKKRLLRRYL